MAIFFLPIVSLILLSLISTSTPTSTTTPTACVEQAFTNNRRYSFCSDLPSLDARLHWSYEPARSTLSIAFLAPARPEGWISWAINPTATGMVGSQALIAFRNSTGAMSVQTYNISSYGPVGPPSRVWYEVREASAEFAGGLMSLFAAVVLPEGTTATAVNHVWQVGPSVTGGVPDRHAFGAANLNARGRLDLLRGQSVGGGGGVGGGAGGGAGGGGGGSRSNRRNIHGILNVVSWGIMFPIGIIISRYIRAFPSADPAWFYSHISCQVSAYAIGVSGWATGLKLGSESRGVTYSGHRNIGIALFSLATVQVFALLLRPKKDHKIRFYWNIYHHGIGYAILILGIINVFKGLNILQPEIKWRNAYIVVISVLGLIAVLLEAITWIIVLRRKKAEKSTKPYDGFNNGHSRQEPLAP